MPRRPYHIRPSPPPCDAFGRGSRTQEAVCRHLRLRDIRPYLPDALFGHAEDSDRETTDEASQVETGSQLPLVESSTNMRPFSSDLSISSYGKRGVHLGGGGALLVGGRIIRALCQHAIRPAFFRVPSPTVCPPLPPPLTSCRTPPSRSWCCLRAYTQGGFPEGEGMNGRPIACHLKAQKLLHISLGHPFHANTERFHIFSDFSQLLA